ncbi:Collagenase-like protease [Escherichia coli P12b]|nr:Collagenase-like protease [Escherichia coli P12b]
MTVSSHRLELLSPARDAAIAREAYFARCRCCLYRRPWFWCPS